MALDLSSHVFFVYFFPLHPSQHSFPHDGKMRITQYMRSGAIHRIWAPDLGKQVDLDR